MIPNEAGPGCRVLLRLVFFFIYPVGYENKAVDKYITGFALLVV